VKWKISRAACQIQDQLRTELEDDAAEGRAVLGDVEENVLLQWEADRVSSSSVAPTAAAQNDAGAQGSLGAVAAVQREGEREEERTAAIVCFHRSRAGRE
jgi:hypothetical protein